MPGLSSVSAPSPVLSWHVLAVAPWSSVSVKHPIDIVIETIQLESIERIEYDISDRNLSLQLCNCMTTLRHICSATSHQAKRPTAAARN